jgi:hypothetical protein
MQIVFKRKGVINLNKFIVSTLVAAGWIIAATAGVAAAGEFTHAYRPDTVRSDATRATTEFPNSQVGWMHARVNNNTGMGQTPLVCVEAWRGSRKTHLGCLTLTMGVSGFSDANWAQGFNAPTHLLTTPGVYRIVYSYRDQFGDWHAIKGPSGENWDGVVVR